MSDFVKQHASIVEFTTSDSWVVLSDIEMSIKKKIEAVGVPLKDWDIQIYRGILTGLNEAFIINEEKRNEILSKCATVEEKERTEQIIRPILRGRDIERYGYNWKGLYLINFHNGLPEKNLPALKIKDYPAIKEHLDNFLPQLTIRADQGDTPYNLRSCAYLDEFSKPKIIYPNMTKYMPFLYDDKGFYTNQKCFIITGKDIAFLTLFLNSSLFKYCFRDSFPELLGGTRELSKVFFDKIPIKQVEETHRYQSILADIQQEYSKEKEMQIDEIIFDLYGLSSEERTRIGHIEIK